MSSGTPDYSINTETVITASVVLSALVDIVAQTVGNIEVDIVAQALSNLSVDIAAQSLANLSVDIAAQTLTNMDIDIIAQTIGNLDIDVNAQSLAEIINRPKYGGTQIGTYSNAAIGSGSITMIEVSAKGLLYGGWCFVDGTDTRKDDTINMYLDGNLINTVSFATLLDRNQIKLLSDFCYILKYDETDFEYCVGLPQGITFETHFRLDYTHGGGANVALSSDIYYATI